MPQMEWNREVDKWQKRCSKCDEVFASDGASYADGRSGMLQHFYKYNNESRADLHTSGDNLHSRCKECHSHSVHGRNHNGIKREEMLLVQEGKCAICEKDISFTENTAAVDHDHKTRKIREILCHQCNHAIGSFFDNTEVMKKAISYLEKHRG